MEQFYKNPRTPLRMREGALGAYVDALAQQLSDEGYAKVSGRQALQLVADFGRWLRRRKVIASQLTPEHLQCYLECRSRRRRRRRGDATMLQRLFDLLLVKGAVAPVPQSEPTPAQRLEQEFRQYLNRERRVAPATVSLYLPFARRFLAECFADGNLQLDSVRAAGGWSTSASHARQANDHRPAVIPAIRALPRSHQLRFGFKCSGGGELVDGSASQGAVAG
jgi:hypothetical protein